MENETLDIEHHLPLKFGNLFEALKNSARIAYGGAQLGGGVTRLVLIIQARPGSTAAELGRVTRIDKAAISRTLKTMQEESLLRTTLTGKRSRYWLSEKGLAAHAVLLPIARARQAAIVDGFSSEEIAQLLALIERLRINLTREQRTAAS